MEKQLLLILLAICALNNVETARILAAIPTASYSHQVFFQLLWRELAIRGHEVVVLTTDPTHENLTNFKEIDMSSAYTIMKQGIREVIELNDNKLEAYKSFSRTYYRLSEFELQLPEVQQLLKDESQQFDLVMIEYLYPTFFGLKHRFNCPFIGVVSLDALSSGHEIMGNPTHAIMYPNALIAAHADMTFTQRLMSFLFTHLTSFSRGAANKKINYLNQKYMGENYPDVGQIAQSVDMMFINANPMFSAVRPLTPSTINIAGGLHMKPAQPLSEDLKLFLDGSKNGVIYFSMGSNVKSKDLSNSTLNTIMQTFSQLPYDVLWKFEADILPGKPKNVKIIKWAPQQDILRHINIKLFITQAGMQSLEEALFSHVPLITMPFLGDQDANAAKIAHKGLGIMLNYKTLSVEEFKSSILEVITNPKYKNEIKKLAMQIQDQPMTPLEKAVWWTEYVIRHKGTQHLKGPKIPTYQYYYLDVLAFLSACVIFILFIIFVVCKLLYSFAIRLSQRVTIKIKRA